MRHVLGSAFVVAGLSLVSWIGPPAAAEESRWHVMGQVRPRGEFRNGYRVLPTDEADDGVFFISQRSRLGATYSSDPRLSMSVILQDVRTWGDEAGTATDYSADNFDIFRAFVDLKPDTLWTLRIGRQELGYDEERILGDGDWAQQGRSHDAIRAMYDNGRQAAHVAVAHHEQGEPLRHVTYTNIGTYRDLALVWARYQGAHGSISALALYDTYEDSGSEILPAGVPVDRWTMGGRIEGRTGHTHGRAEAYWQTGNRHRGTLRADVSAYMFALEADQDFSKTNVMLWYDHLSGDEHPTDTDIEWFDPPYATGHRFYGWADYFLNIPVDTYGRGLRNLALKVKTPLPRASTLDVQLHYFWLAQEYPLGVEDPNSALGFEGDLMITVPVMQYVRIQGGYSYVHPTEFTKDVTGGDSPGHWLWTMLDVNVK